jgi:two-component system sensor histidine kinase BaeS
MLEYVNKKELASLELLSKNLAHFYQQSQSWESLVMTNNVEQRISPRRQNSRHAPQSEKGKFRPSKKWHQIVKFSNDGITLPENIEQYLQSNEGFRPKRIRGSGPPPSQRKPRVIPPQQRLKPNDGKLHPSLLNAKKQRVLGLLNKDYNLQAIYMNGTIIGYLALPPKTRLTDTFDLAFTKQIKENLLYLFLGLFIIIIILAIPMSRHFVKPIKRLEHAMRALNKGDFKVKTNVVGNDELSSLALHFNDLAKTLEQNENSRNNWLANISHELRTPISIIKGEIEAIQDGIRPLDFNGLSSLNEEIEHLHKLVNDLSALSNAEIGAMRYQKQRLNLTTAIKNNLMRHQHKANESNITISHHLADKKCTIWADETRINQLIDNLINNSFKYTKSPGKINISLTKTNSHVILSISDSFPGVPDDSLPKVFDHLYRVESSRNRKTGGSGLGLALCKKIMSAHQGNINANHSAIGGLEISCAFPLITK